MIRRYVRAFVVALRMTLRGEQFTPKYPELNLWTQEAVKRVDEVYRIADANGLMKAEREALILHLDKRDISMETILAAVKHHAAQEYVRLLHDSTQHTRVAIHASNLNDRYRIAQLTEKITLSAVKTALRSLSEHLDSIPTEAQNVKNL